MPSEPSSIALPSRLSSLHPIATCHTFMSTNQLLLSSLKVLSLAAIQRQPERDRYDCSTHLSPSALLLTSDSSLLSRTQQWSCSQSHWFLYYGLWTPALVLNLFYAMLMIVKLHQFINTFCISYRPTEKEAFLWFSLRCLFPA